ncbi:hypothetical protein EA473_10390 [Natrarchaeobius chitinivorans]|uniref:Uncharacterized protein n=1 Tax=Natrarchaeobius chitinivorans TaxID=1679083 RepID=A0A3N6LWA9_NATCH|nr:hypothetical protein EA473_10390 [Natrarchaeobius chitinivorans]
MATEGTYRDDPNGRFVGSRTDDLWRPERAIPDDLADSQSPICSVRDPRELPVRRDGGGCTPRE